MREIWCAHSKVKACLRDDVRWHGNVTMWQRMLSTEDTWCLDFVNVIMIMITARRLFSLLQCNVWQMWLVIPGCWGGGGGWGVRIIHTFIYIWLWRAVVLLNLKVNLLSKRTHRMYYVCILSLKVWTSSGHAIALWQKRCWIDQKRLIILHNCKYWYVLQSSGIIKLIGNLTKFW